MQRNPLPRLLSLHPRVCRLSLTLSLPHLPSADGHRLTVFACSVGSTCGLLLCLCPQELELLVLQSQEVGLLRLSWSSIASDWVEFMAELKGDPSTFGLEWVVLLWLEQALQLNSLFWNLGSAPIVTLGSLNNSRPVCSSVKKGVIIVPIL